MSSNNKFFLILIFSISIIQTTLAAEYDSLIAISTIFYINPKAGDDPSVFRLPDAPTPIVSKSKDIKLLIHGWNAKWSDLSMETIKYAYLAKGHDAILMADWQKAAKVFYADARFFVRPVGIRLAEMLKDFMGKNNIDPSRIHILGHSLGAHIAGNIGEYFNGTIGRITGLDPAGPLFEAYALDGLMPKHARFVDCIHTASPTLGQTLQRGHIDFYPNYGKYRQPGCEYYDILTATGCSHFRGQSYFAESIQVPFSFPSFACPLKNILEEKCVVDNKQSVVFMGESVSQKERGSYYLQTNNRSPFGKGMFSSYMNTNNGTVVKPTSLEATPPSVFQQLGELLLA